MSKALIVVDMQQDFISGSLAVPDAEKIIPTVANMIGGRDYELVVLTRDWHPQDTPHFERWPVHCVAGTTGAELDERIEDALWVLASSGTSARVITKGEGDTDGYSGFEGVTWDGLSLQELLDHAEPETVDVVGLAFDYCVKATALDSAGLGYHTRVPILATRWVDIDTATVTVLDLEDAGVEVTT